MEVQEEVLRCPMSSNLLGLKLLQAANCPYHGNLAEDEAPHREPAQGDCAADDKRGHNPRQGHMGCLHRLGVHCEETPRSVDNLGMLNHCCVKATACAGFVWCCVAHSVPAAGIRCCWYRCHPVGSDVSVTACQTAQHWMHQKAVLHGMRAQRRCRCR